MKIIKNNNRIITIILFLITHTGHADTLLENLTQWVPGLSTGIQQSNTNFRGGVTANGGKTFETHFVASQSIDILADIFIAPEHVSKSGSIFLVAQYNNSWYTKNTQGQWIDWNFKLKDLAPSIENKKLDSIISVSVQKQLSNISGSFSVWVGYKVDNDIYYNSQPFQFIVSHDAIQSPTKFSLVGVSSLSNNITAEWIPAQDDQTPQDKLVYSVHISESKGFIPSSTTVRLSQRGITSANVTDLTPGKLYYVKVTATNEQGSESWSNELSITTASVDVHTRSIKIQVQNPAQTPQASQNTVTYFGGATSNPGDYIASSEGDGYLRKVIGVQKQGNQTNVTTQNASLNEIFDALQINTSIY